MPKINDPASYCEDFQKGWLSIWDAVCNDAIALIHKGDDMGLLNNLFGGESKPKTSNVDTDQLLRMKCSTNRA